MLIVLHGELDSTSLACVVDIRVALIVQTGFQVNYRSGKGYEIVLRDREEATCVIGSNKHLRILIDI